MKNLELSNKITKMRMYSTDYPQLKKKKRMGKWEIDESVENIHK